MNNLVTPQEKERRFKSLPQPIRELAVRHPLIQRIAYQYAHGLIMSLEGALETMVIELAKENKDDRDHLLRYIVRFGSVDFSIVPPPLKLDCVGNDGCKVTLPTTDR